MQEYELAGWRNRELHNEREVEWRVDGVVEEEVKDKGLKCTPIVRHKTIRVLCIDSTHLKNDWRLC